MTYSPLTAYTRTTNKRSSRQGLRPSRLIIHHTAGGDLAGLIHTLSTGPPQKSCTYLLGVKDAALIGIVPEEYRPWTSGSFTADGPAITVETQNTTGAPRWEVSDAQVERLAQLAADCSRRYGWGPLTRRNVLGHRDYDSTACPGPYLYPRLNQIINRANAILAGATTKEDDMPSAADVWNHQFKAYENDKPGGMPAETAGVRLRRGVHRAGQALIMSRSTAADVKGLEALVLELGERQGLTAEEMKVAIAAGTKAALKDSEVTLRVDIDDEDAEA